MNKIMILGRLVRNPETKATANGNMVTFSVADDKKYKREGHPSANFIDCVAFGKNAENIEKYFKQGNKILLFGRLEMDFYEKDGKKIPTSSVIVDEWYFGGDRGKTSNQMSSKQDFMNIPEGFEEECIFC